MSDINGSAVEPSSPASYDTGHEDAVWGELTQIAGRRGPALAS